MFAQSAEKDRPFKSWDKKDSECSQFFVYILKKDNNKFYIGQTNDLRARLSEHKDGKAYFTKGLNPQLQYFEILTDRQSAQQRELELIRLNSQNEREIRRMIINFKDLIDELSYDK